MIPIDHDRARQRSRQARLHGVFPVSDDQASGFRCRPKTIDCFDLRELDRIDKPCDVAGAGRQRAKLLRGRGNADRVSVLPVLFREAGRQDEIATPATARRQCRTCSINRGNNSLPTRRGRWLNGA